MAQHVAAKKKSAKKKSAKKKPASVQLVVRNPHGTAVAPSGPLSVFERFARDKTIDVDKLGKLIELQKDILHVQAIEAFNVAFVAMQNDLPSIGKHGKIIVKGALRSHYAKLEDIQAAVRPILQRHGFALRHRTEWPKEKTGIIRVVGILAHVQGHSEESAFEAPMDASDYRTDIQSMGSTVSYGRRYTTIDLLNLRQVGVDDDGQKGPSRQRETTEAPPAHTTGHEQEPISEGQLKRLFVIAGKSGRKSPEIKAFLKARYALDSSKAILRKDYEAICTAIETPGPLPGPVREADEILSATDIKFGLR